jgi:hypothetical protein
MSPMNKDELKSRIKGLAADILKNRKKAETKFVEYDELTKFPELKSIIIDLLTVDFDPFLSSIDWVAPKPTTFRINLKNGQSFYLIYNERSWIAQIEGKKYYLLNLAEEQHATEAISRILRYESEIDKDAEEDINSEDPLDAIADEETEETPE